VIMYTDNGPNFLFFQSSQATHGVNIVLYSGQRVLEL
jgi:hypothetical protein